MALNYTLLIQNGLKVNYQINKHPDQLSVRFICDLEHDIVRYFVQAFEESLHLYALLCCHNELLRVKLFVKLHDFAQIQKSEQDSFHI